MQQWITPHTVRKAPNITWKAPCLIHKDFNAIGGWTALQLFLTVHVS